MNAREAFNVREAGPADGPVMLFAHGFGCEQGMWRHMAPDFVDDHRVVLFDHAGLGGSDPRVYDPARHATLDGYADDVLRICEELELTEVTFVGHSVSGMIGALAARRAPDRFSNLVMICPSARYVNDPEHGYHGGFSRDDIDELLSTLSMNYMGWATSIAPAIMGAPTGDPLTDELAATFCRAEPGIARRFATATFLGDNRDDLPHVPTRTLVIRTTNDMIAPASVGAFVADQLPDSKLVTLDVSGHCPNMSAPVETSAAIKAFL